MIKPKYRFVISEKVFTTKEYLQKFSFFKFLVNRFNAKTIYFANPYQGCELTCQYCSISKAPFISDKNYYPTIQIRTNTPYTIKQMLPDLKTGSVVYFSADGDPYQEAEKQYQLTHHSLELLLDSDASIIIVTRRTLILRDLVLLKKFAVNNRLTVAIPIVSTDPKLVQMLEPGTTNSNERLELLKILRKNKISAGAILWPVLPLINDNEKELDTLMARTKKCGAEYFLFKELSLQGMQQKRFYGFLQTEFPYLLHRYQEIYRKSFFPSEQYTAEFKETFIPLCKKHGFESIF